MRVSEEFASHLAFGLDAFQADGIRALEEGRSVLVAAPTGAGKTVVGDFAVWRALRSGHKSFYTTPIKALSNQKFRDLRAVHGEERVGLLTGDRVVNGEAPVVVMTTEVLRNMLYEESPTLDGLQAVVLDEVHYLSDRERGAVWEEVIVQLPPDVQLACLSATVSNAEEFGAWLAHVRGGGEGEDAGQGEGEGHGAGHGEGEGEGEGHGAGQGSAKAGPGEGHGEGCDVVISDERPVPLSHHYAYNDRLEPMFRAGGKQGGRKPSNAKVEAARQAKGGVPNPEIVMMERRGAGSGRRTKRGRPVPGGAKMRPPRRGQLALELRRRAWLPAIIFVFSRHGCDAAVEQLVGDGLSLTSGSERSDIRAIIDERVADLAPHDLDVLGYRSWREALSRGIAAHHAGMVPAFKETVEELFVRGLLKVCFATETLALGINMPARTVVIERLEKWDGQQHALLTPGQFTQLTGRAGRRGLDRRGYAVVLHQRDIDFPTVASLVSRRVEPLTSRFQPSYNMAVNILRRHDREQAEALLARSFAQWQADRHVSGDVERIQRNRAALEGYARNLHSEHGDFGEYWALRRELSRLERDEAKKRRHARHRAVEEGLSALQPGDVARIDDDELVAVTGVRLTRSGVPLAEAVTADRRLVRVGPRELSAPPVRVTGIELPRNGGPRQAAYRKQVANALRRVEVPTGRFGPSDGDQDGGRADEVGRLRAEVRAHPAHDDPALADIEVWAHRHDELAADTERLENRVRQRTGSLLRRFDRILAVLTELGYLEEDEGGQPRPTGRGQQLATLYAETDLLLAEALRHGLLASLEPADLAAVASCFVFETRVKDPAEPELPNRLVAEQLQAVAELWAGLAAREEQAGLPPTPAPDWGFAAAAWRWASGAELDDALAGEEMTAGDFVRNVKQVADLLRQLRDAVSDRDLSDRCHAANKALVRGVVAHSGV